MKTDGSLDIDFILFLRGDLTKCSILTSIPHEHLFNLYDDNKCLVDRGAVLNAVNQYKNKIVTEDEMKKWASFIRWGYFPTPIGKEPVKPIDVLIDEKNDFLSDIIFRFEELGDEIDGEVSSRELCEILSMLKNDDN